MLATLTPWDYLIIFAMMLISTGIGVFFAIKSRRGQTSSDYFLGSRNMSLVPVSLSLAATVMSAITYLGTPAEVYIHGPKIGLLFFARIVASIVIMFAFVPVFYRSNITTVYEYLAMRFNNTLRFLVIAMKFFHDFLYMGIVIYAPALALSTVTKINLTFSIVTVGVVCTFYTSLGGIKAVIWTDVFQAIVMVIGSTIVIIVGTIQIGGLAEGWRRAAEGSRTELVDFNLNPTVRVSFWSTMIGGSILTTYTAGVKQSLVQRYNSCRNEKEAKIASFLGILGMGTIQLLAVAAGMTAFAYYSDCDPLTSGKINRPDQILPYFMMDVFYLYPGMPGILIGGAFCASLSSLSSVLNGVAAAIGQDIVKTIWPNMSEKRYTITVKIISAVCGGFTILLAFLASVLGDVLQSTLSISGAIGGPILGVFLLGMFVPRCNSKGAITGLLAGIAVGLFLFIGSMVNPPVLEKPPLSTEGCSQPVNGTFSETDMWTESFPTTTFSTHVSSGSPNSTTKIVYMSSVSVGPGIFGLSYLYLSAVTSLITVTVGATVSILTTFNNPTMADPKLLAPIVTKYFANDENKSTLNQKEYVALSKV